MCIAPQRPLEQDTSDSPEKDSLRREICQALKALSNQHKDPATLNQKLWALLSKEQQILLAIEWGGYDSDLAIKAACRNAQIDWYKSVFGTDATPWDEEEIEEKVDLFFERHDVDRDDTVSWQEWMHSRSALMLSQENRLREALCGDEKIALNCIFRSADRNKNGQISWAEALNFYSIRLDHMIMNGIVPKLDDRARRVWVQWTVKSFFNAHDRLEYEGIGLEEFQESEAKFVIMGHSSKKANLAHALSSPKNQAKLDEGLDSEQAPLELDQVRLEHARLMYKQYDSDNNGISFSNLKALLKDLKIVSVSPSVLRRIRRKAFKAADQDHDQLIDFQEFLSIYSFFYARSGDFHLLPHLSEGIVVNTEECKARYFFDADQLESFADGVEQKRLAEIHAEFKFANPKRIEEDQTSTQAGQDVD